MKEANTMIKEAMKLMVAEMEYVLSCINEDKIPFDGDDFHEALRLGRQAIDTATQIKQAQPSQRDIKQSASVEPAAMRYDFDGYGYKYIDSGSGSDWQTRIKDAEPMFASPPQHALMAEHWKEQYEQMKAQRQWVGLTDEEVRDVYQNYMENPDDTWDYERAIEAKLKEKNNG